ncbi:MAG: aspartate aminotransferase family protein [Candidatus Adiutrix sp.]|jgi:predicted acetylornithine/succinylornithine family transaminase|nr:aspartate aminotransferase family protein [Candidatus Adiutrix sp.]
MSLSTREIMEMAHQHLMGNVTRFELALTHGRGMKVWDAEGREYLDFLGGIATCALGYAPEAVIRTISEQAGKLIHVSNYYYTEPLVRLAARLTGSSGLDKAFFCNSGGEANEAALKLARKYSHDLYGPGRYGVITAQGSFHGRTLGTISATGQDQVKRGFEPLLPGFTHVPYGDLAALKAAVTPETCAIMLEPILGEGGVVVPPPDYLPGVADLCAEKKLLLILDEIQTGLGRTGQPYAFQHYDLKPHIMTLAKALGGGVASGAMLAQDEVAAHLTPGSHSTTVGGAPLAMAVGLVMVETILEPAFLKNVAETGRYFLERLQNLARELGPLAKEARGQGLLVGLELTRPSGPVAAGMIKRGFLISATAGTVLRFAPPLIATPAEVDILIPALKETIQTLGK